MQNQKFTPDDVVCRALRKKGQEGDKGAQELIEVSSA